MSSGLPSKQAGGSQLIVRSTNVPANKSYKEYKPWLRHDFFCSCAYCTMSEAEAQAIRFTIDHYEPKDARPDLIDIYDNLMYCCDECNIRKGDRCPPTSARENGIRFFRPDTDYWHEHFRRNGVRLEGSSGVGEFTIDAIDLNRKSLVELRKIRESLGRCNEEISEGISALRGFPIDLLPPGMRLKVLQVVDQAVSMADELTNAIEHTLREAAKSPFVGVESEPELEERTRERQRRLKETEALHPGNWRRRRRRKRV
jgi:HNH endonuclease